MIRRTKLVLVPVALALSALAPMAAEATDPLSYSFIEGQYLNSTLKPTVPGAKNEKTEGYRAGLNISLYKFIYFAGDIDKRRGSQYRFGTQSVGLGAHTDSRLSPHLQGFLVASYERTLLNDLTKFVPDDSDEGYGVQAGVRVPYDNFELTGSYRYMNYGKTGNTSVTGDKFGAEVLVQISPFFGLTADYRRLDLTHFQGGTGKREFDEWTVGFRTYFATDIDRYRRRGGFFGHGE